MSDKKQQGKKKGGAGKYGRNKRTSDSATSLYAKGKITFEQYKKAGGN